MFSPNNPPTIKRGHSFWEENEWDNDYDYDTTTTRDTNADERDDRPEHEQGRRSGQVHLQPKKKLRVTTNFSLESPAKDGSIRLCLHDSLLSANDHVADTHINERPSTPTHDRSLILAESTSFDVDTETDATQTWSPSMNSLSSSTVSLLSATEDHQEMFRTPESMTQKYFFVTSPPMLANNPRPMVAASPVAHPQVISWENFMIRDDLPMPFLPNLDEDEDDHESSSSCSEDSFFFQRFLSGYPVLTLSSSESEEEEESQGAAGNMSTKDATADVKTQNKIFPSSDGLTTALTDLKLQQVMSSPSSSSTSTVASSCSNKENTKPTEETKEDNTAYFRKRASFKSLDAMRGSYATADSSNASIPPRRKTIHIARAA